MVKASSSATLVLFSKDNNNPLGLVQRQVSGTRTLLILEATIKLKEFLTI